MTTDEFELRRLVKNLAHLYATLDDLKWTPTRQEQVRKMKPSFNSQTPSPDGDWALNLQIELMRDTPDDTIPGGLRTMACDALNHTTARGYGHETNPSVLCAHLYRHAQEITENFPATEELTELLTKQTHYIHTKITHKQGTTPPPQLPPNTMSTGLGTAADLAPLATAITGLAITRKQITYWGRAGHITTYLQPDGTATYQLAQVVEHARTYTDGRKRKRHL